MRILWAIVNGNDSAQPVVAVGHFTERDWIDEECKALGAGHYVTRIRQHDKDDLLPDGVPIPPPNCHWSASGGTSKRGAKRRTTRDDDCVAAIDSIAAVQSSTGVARFGPSFDKQEAGSPSDKIKRFRLPRRMVRRKVPKPGTPLRGVKLYPVKDHSSKVGFDTLPSCITSPCVWDGAGI